MAQKAVWGVDIGNSAIKAIKIVRQGDTATIVDFDIIDVQAPDEEGSRAARVQAALQTLVTNHSFGDDPVFLALPGDQCLFREFSLPPGSEGKISDLVEFEAKQQIPFPRDQIELAWEKFTDPAGGMGVELIFVRKAIVQEILDLTDRFKLRVHGISVSPAAQFNFINYEFRPQGVTMLLDAGYRGTDFVVMQGGHIYSRTIPIGGREITRALETKFKVPYEKAEELKKNISQSKQADKILGVIEPTLRQLGAEIQRTIGYYKSKSKGQRIQQGFLLGHTFRLPRMAESLASQIREAPLTVVEGVNRIQLDPSVNPEVFAHEFPTMAVAIGLGIQGLGLGELTINLLPKSRQVEEKVRRKKIWGFLSAAAVLVALYASYDSNTQELARIDELEKELQDAVKETTKFKGDLDAEAKAVPGLKDELLKATRVARDRGRIPKVFQEMGQLKDTAGEAFFSPKRKVFMNGLYISRVPYVFDQGSLPPAVGSAGDVKDRRDMLRASVGLRSLYAELTKVKDPVNAPPHRRPDVPLCVIISGECEGDEGRMFQVLQELETALQKVPGVVKASIKRSDRKPNLRRAEPLLVLNDKGAPFTDKPVDGERQAPYCVFHVCFRYAPTDEPADIMP